MTRLNANNAISDTEALALVIEMMAIPGRSGEEAAVMDYILGKLIEAGVPRSALSFDDANRRTPLGGQVGNLVSKLPGTMRGPRRMLSAHVDTVPICVGSRPVRKGKYVVSANKETGLGADDRSGAAILLSAVLAILGSKLFHPPLTFLWSVQEEIGLFGARYVGLSKLGKPRLAFNFDGGAANALKIGATGGYRMTIEIEGLASHAGNRFGHCSNRPNSSIATIPRTVGWRSTGIPSWKPSTSPRAIEQERVKSTRRQPSTNLRPRDFTAMAEARMA